MLDRPPTRPPARAPTCLPVCPPSNVAWAAATLGSQAPPWVLPRVVAFALTHAATPGGAPALASWGPVALSTLAWACATAGLPRPLALSSIAAACLDGGGGSGGGGGGGTRAGGPPLHAWRPLELSNTLWAFAHARHPAPALFDAAAAHVMALPPARRRTTFQARHVARLLWAFARQVSCAA